MFDNRKRGLLRNAATLSVLAVALAACGKKGEPEQPPPRNQTR